MSNYNILYTNLHFGYGGGHTTYIRSLLRNPEHTAFVACAPSSLLYKTLQEQGFPRLEPIEFYAKLKDARKVALNALRLKRCIEKNAIDIVHTNGSNDNRMATYVSFFSRRKFKIVFTKHNAFPVTGAASRFRFRRINDAVIFVSETTREATRFHNTYPHFHVIKNGIDPEYWKRGQPVATGAKLRLVSTAGTVSSKGWIHLAEAVASLPAADRKRLSVQVLGRYEPEFEEMQNQARELCGMEFPGFFTDPRPLLEDADIAFNLSYFKEGCSFALREMMSMSLPAIVSDYPALVNDIDDGCGWVTRMKDAESIAAVLRKILDADPQNLNQMKQAARRRAEERFSIDKMILETNRVYAGLFDEQGA
jgi:glycosyltransferase involved in cell wall biosynthesis